MIHCIFILKILSDSALFLAKAGSGATAMAEAGAEPQLIKGAGQWSSSDFERYIRKNLVVLHALILSRSSHYDA